MAYKVIKYFTDLKDGGYAYNVGDEYPRKGVSATQSRIKELLSDKNKRKTPLIAEVEEKPKKKKSDTTDEE